MVEDYYERIAPAKTHGGRGSLSSMLMGGRQ
jgi:hypothetical protein